MSGPSNALPLVNKVLPLQRVSASPATLHSGVKEENPSDPLQKQGICVGSGLSASGGSSVASWYSESNPSGSPRIHLSDSHNLIVFMWKSA